ncbi:MAG: hypothetical protein Q8T03_06295 [Bacteroidota bacterium]|nr:hypothetical protein [Bacteroidota bacterium]
MKSLFKVAAILTIGLMSVNSYGQKQEEIISKHIEAIGGKDNWSKVKSIRSEATMKAQGAEIKMVFLQVDKKAMRQNISLMGMEGYSIITEKEGWSFMPFQGQTKPEPMTADDVKNSQDDLYLQDKFLTYKELGCKLEYIGTDDMDGTECFKFKMTDKNGEETTYFLDASSYLTIKQTNKIKADGKEMENATMFSNYKKLPEGIVYPMTVASGWGDAEFTKVEINPVIDEKEFKLPK